MIAFTEIKRGARYPSLTQTLPELGTPTGDLTGCTVQLKIRNASGLLVVDAPAVVVGSPSARTVRYDWAVNDTATAGGYDFEFWITETATGKSQKYPLSGYLPLRINPDTSLAGIAPIVDASTYRTVVSAALAGGETFVDFTWPALASIPTKFFPALLVADATSDIIGPLVIELDSVTTTGARVAWLSGAPAGAKISLTAWI